MILLMEHKNYSNINNPSEKRRRKLVEGHDFGDIKFRELIAMGEKELMDKSQKK